MKARIMLILSVMLMTGLILTSSVLSQDDKGKITASQLKTRIEDGLDGELIDLRGPSEVVNGTLPGAQVINFQAPDFQDRLKRLDRSKKYYVYCHSGGRSGKASKMMTDMGFKNVIDYSGGFSEWSALEYPLVNKRK